jgi:diguanylate cyclase (GGDEF)-like protein
MHETDVETPIPVLLVGHGASAILPSLVAGLVAAEQATRFACAAFERAPTAAGASTGATHLVLVGLGDEADAILADPVWEAWERPGTAVARIALSDALPSVDAGAVLPPEPAFGGLATYRMPMAQAEALPMAVVVVSQLLEAERSREVLRAELATERACEPLATCLDPGKIYPMTLELLLEQIDARRGIAFFSPSPAPRSSGVAARGFDDETRDRLTRILIEEKSLEATMGRGEVGVVPWGPLHHALGQVGVEAPGPLLSVPLRGEEREAGHLWILSDGRRFSERDLATARTVARRASAALATAERYHDAKERAFIDDVTGVYNARYLLATADNEIQRAERYGNPLSVLFLDLDRFKLVNDRYGHLIGSDTLRVLSRLLRDCVRQVDTLARYGGDEFTILLVDTPHEVAMRIAERIRSRVEKHLFEAGREGSLRLTISIGVATCPNHGKTRELLLDAADKAMYRAKSEGRNRVASADDLGD